MAFWADFRTGGLFASETFWKRSRHYAELSKNTEEFGKCGCGGLQPAVLAAVEWSGMNPFDGHFDQTGCLRQLAPHACGGCPCFQKKDSRCPHVLQHHVCRRSAGSEKPSL